MTSIVQVLSGHVAWSRAVQVPDYNVCAMQDTAAIQRLPLESVGAFTLTLTNIVVGSVVRIEIAGSGAEIETRTADATTEVFTVPAYAAGSANNDLRIKVRKGSSGLAYRPYETLATAAAGSGSVYVSQIPDE